MTTSPQTTDTLCTLVPYFRIQDDHVDEFRALVPQFIAKAATEPGCLHYAFSFDGVHAHCREGYADGAAILAHLENVNELLQRALTLSELARLEVHAPADQVELLREPMAGLNPQFFTLVDGFRR